MGACGSLPMGEESPGRVVVAMSGGVDSSVAAALLKERGYEVVGITMRLWDSQGPDTPSDSACCFLEAMDDARAVCDKLGVPHIVMDLKETFEQAVIQNFVGEYLSGRTPNPCVRCNAYVKWAALLAKARALGAEYVATGHYARLALDAEKQRVLLRKGADPHKDQSYALWRLDQEQLGRTLFPLGEMQKEEVRQCARSMGLKTSARRESQQVCFIPDDSTERFLRQRVGSALALSQGLILDTSGHTLGYHRGVGLYTVGQRKGLGIAAGRPLYVIRLDAQRNAVWVGDKKDLKSDRLVAGQLNWISVEGLDGPLGVKAKIRYLHPAASATIRPEDPSRVTVRFHDPQYAITPGQSVVFYDEDRVVGGGIIERAGA